MFDTVERNIGPIEVCLFNAGANTHRPALETSGDLYEKVWRLACFAGFVTGREAVRRMVPRGAGTLLFTGATASMRGGPGFAAFAAAKAGLRSVAQSLAREFGPHGIHVAHLVIDGGVDSPAIHARRRARDGADAPPPSVNIHARSWRNSAMTRLRSTRPSPRWRWKRSAEATRNDDDFVWDVASRQALRK